MNLEDFSGQKADGYGLIIKKYNFSFEVDLVGFSFTYTRDYTEAMRERRAYDYLELRESNMIQII